MRFATSELTVERKLRNRRLTDDGNVEINGRDLPALCRMAASVRLLAYWADEIITVAYRSDIEDAEKRVITENLRWLLSKLAPTRYGDRLLLAGDPENPIQHLHKSTSLSALSDDQLDALEAFANRMMIEQKPGNANG